MAAQIKLECLFFRCTQSTTIAFKPLKHSFLLSSALRPPYPLKTATDYNLIVHEIVLAIWFIRRVTEAVYGRYRFRYGWKKQNKMHQKKLHSYCVLTVKTDPPMVLCRPYRSLVLMNHQSQIKNVEISQPQIIHLLKSLLTYFLIHPLLIVS